MAGTTAAVLAHLMRLQGPGPGQIHSRIGGGRLEGQSGLRWKPLAPQKKRGMRLECTGGPYKVCSEVEEYSF